MPDHTFKIQAESESHARTRVTARKFTIIVDEPPELGGTDAGPNPVEYVLAALAGCINVTAYIVAKELKISLKGLSIEMQGDLNPAKLLNRPTEDRAGYKSIQAIVQAKTDADEETLAKWRSEIEKRCPVSDNLGNNTPIDVKVVASNG